MKLGRISVTFKDWIRVIFIIAIDLVFGLKIFGLGLRLWFGFTLIKFCTTVALGQSLRLGLVLGLH